MRILIILTVCVSLLLSCKKEGKKNDMVMPEPKFVRVLIDYSLAQSLNSSLLYRKKSEFFKEYSVIDTVFTRHHITRAIFDSSLAFYAKDPKHLDAIYDQVMNEFNRRSAAIQAKMDAEKKKTEKKTSKKK